MMIKPGITELSKCVDSRYTLVTMAAKRARMIGGHSDEDDYEIDYRKEKDGKYRWMKWAEWLRYV